jgi:hypothetical protein
MDATRLVDIRTGSACRIVARAGDTTTLTTTPRFFWNPKFVDAGQVPYERRECGARSLPKQRLGSNVYRMHTHTTTHGKTRRQAPPPTTGTTRASGCQNKANAETSVTTDEIIPQPVGTNRVYSCLYTQEPDEALFLFSNRALLQSLVYSE